MRRPPRLLDTYCDSRKRLNRIDVYCWLPDNAREWGKARLTAPYLCALSAPIYCFTVTVFIQNFIHGSNAEISFGLNKAGSGVICSLRLVMKNWNSPFYVQLPFHSRTKPIKTKRKIQFLLECNCIRRKIKTKIKDAECVIKLRVIARRTINGMYDLSSVGAAAACGLRTASVVWCGWRIEWWACAME